MKKKIIGLFAVIVILAVAVVYLLATRDVENQDSVKDDTVDEKTEAPNPMQSQVPSDLTVGQKAELKLGVEIHTKSDLTFNITAGSFYFTPNEIRVKQGDKVKIILSNVLGTHNFVLEAFDVSSKTIKDGESDTVEFVADKKGTFEFYCGVGNGYHRMMGQIGVLIVE